MASQHGFSAKTNQSESLKFCGNCRRVNFNLNPEDAQLLQDTAECDGIKRMQAWARSRNPMFTLPHQAYCRYSAVDRARVLKIILTNQTRCSTAKVRIFWPDTACFL